MAGASILVPFDGSAASADALAHAVRLAAFSRGRVTLLGIVPNQPLGLAGAFFVPPVNCADELESELRQLMARAVEELGGVPIGGAIRRGRWTAEVIARVRAQQHDLVIVGVPHRRFPHRLNRRVARLAERCPVPVIVRRQSPASRGPRWRRARSWSSAGAGRPERA